MSKYEFTEDMASISSGRDVAYERCLRGGLTAGMLWLDRHPDAKPEKKGPFDMNADANALEMFIDNATQGSAAMVDAIMVHVLAALKDGWDSYVAASKKRKLERGF